MFGASHAKAAGRIEMPSVVWTLGGQTNDGLVGGGSYCGMPIARGRYYQPYLLGIAAMLHPATGSVAASCVWQRR